MIACCFNKDKMLKVMFANSRMMNWDFNAQTNYGGATGFILASANKQKEAVDLILANYQRLKIDLKIKDSEGKTGMDYWPEKFEGMTIVDV